MSLLAQNALATLFQTNSVQVEHKGQQRWLISKHLVHEALSDIFKHGGHTASQRQRIIAAVFQKDGESIVCSFLLSCPPTWLAHRSEAVGWILGTELWGHWAVICHCNWKRYFQILRDRRI